MNKFLNNFQKWVLIITLFLFPLFFLPITQEFFSTNKFFLLVCGTLIFFALGAIKLLFTRKISLPKTPFDKLLIIFFVVGIISIIFSSPNKLQALYRIPDGLGPLLALILLYFALVSLPGNKNKMLIFNILRISSYILGVIVIIFFFNPLSGAQLPPELEFLKSKTFSPLGSRFDTLVFLSFFALTEISMVFQYIKEKKSFIANIIYTVLLLIAIGITSYTIIKPPDISSRVQLPPAAISWFAAIETLKSPRTALVGVGLDNYASIFTLVKPASHNLTDIWQLNFSVSRSTLLHIWTTMGILGLLTMLLLIVYVIRELHNLYVQKDTMTNLFIVLGLVVLCVLLFLPPSYVIFFMLFVYLAALTNLINKQEHMSSFQTIDLKNLPAIRIIITIVTLTLIGGCSFLALRVYAAEYYFKQSINAFRRNDGRTVYNSQTRAIQLNPTNEMYHTQFSQVNLLLANNLAKKEKLTDQDRQAIAQFIRQSILEAKRVVQLNPQKAAHWNNLALIYRNIINVAQGADAWTIATYRRAMILDPNNPLLRLNVGGVFYSLENYEEAALSFEQAVALKPDWANAQYNLAWAQFQNKKYDQAVLTMQNVLTLLPNKDSEDYKLAQQNLEEFKKKLPEATEASQEGELQIEKPQGPVISPPIELPKESGPETELKDQPTTQEVTPQVSPTPTP